MSSLENNDDSVHTLDSRTMAEIRRQLHVAPDGRDNANPRRIPQLVTSKTAPILGTSRESAMQDLRAFQSSAGFPDGDTQPIDSQLYRSSKVATQSQNEGTGDAWLITNSQPEDTTLHTIAEGENGHINMTSNWTQDFGSSDDVSVDGENTTELSPEAQMRIHQAAQTKAQFLAPKTPGTAGRKRNWKGDVISSDSKTPGSAQIAALFGNAPGAAMMSLTQIFNNTQAPTSPVSVGEEARSDPVFTRPSPGFGQFVNSSPPPPVSSPIKHHRSDPSRATTEPRDAYVTMKESQEKREVHRRARQEQGAVHSDELDEAFQELTAEEQRIARRNRQRQRDLAALKELGNLSAPKTSREVQEKMSKKSVISSDTDFVTPGYSLRKSRKEVISISDDEDESSAEEEELATDTPASTVTSKRISNEPSSAIQVPMTSSKPNALSNETVLRGSSPSKRSEKPHISADRQRDLRTSRTTHEIAVADSQPDQPRPEHGNPSKPIQQESSLGLDSRIMQSQYSTKSEQLRFQKIKALVVDSSSIPLPPLSSSQIDGAEEEQIPSSPPMLPPVRPLEDDRDNVDLIEDNDALVDGDNDQGTEEPYEDNTSRPPCSIKPTYNSKEKQNAPIRQDKQVRSHSTIPETDDVEFSIPQTLNSRTSGRNHNSQHSARDTQNTSTRTNTNATTQLATANTHTSTPSPQKKSQQTMSPRSGARTPGNLGIRKLTDIAAGPSQDNIKDMDLPLSFLQDDEANWILSGSSPVKPRRKRLKVYHVKQSSVESTAQLVEARNRLASLESTETGDTQVNPPAVEQQEVSIFDRDAVLKRGRLSRPSVKVNRKDLGGSTFIVSQDPSPTVLEGEKTSSQMREKKSALQPEKTKTIAGTSKIGASALSTKDVPRQSLQGTESSKANSRSDAPLPGNRNESLQNDKTKPPVPRRVLALFNGTNRSYYPATCLGVSAVDPTRFRIRFDDGTVDDKLEGHNICTLDLRIDDFVKVDLPKMRSNSYVVCGFDDHQPNRSTILIPGDGFPLTDIHGHETVLLAIRSRNSIPQESAKAAEDRIPIPITSLYILPTMWKMFKDRLYSSLTPLLTPESGGNIGRPRTPSITPSVPVTPTSWSRRPLPLQLNSFTSRSAQSQSRAHRLFNNMAFAVSFYNTSLTEAQRENIKTQIVSHGGQVLESGFHQLFDIPSTVSFDTNDDENSPVLKLTREAEMLGFVALITDKMIRTPKYIQALALGLPCVHFRWLSDSLVAGEPLPWSKYLLPAGESMFLSGAIRSRVLSIYPAVSHGNECAEHGFKSVVQRRQHLLKGKNILMVMPAKKAADETRRGYLFLALALGPAYVRTVEGLTAAKGILDARSKAESEYPRGKWDVVHLHSNTSTAEAEACLFGSGTPIGGVDKRRKRKKDIDADGSHKVELGTKVGSLIIVRDEFVVQSLILGELVEI
ncbi:hypothetical protein M501DRAFT_551447 [Patellaria atrata CBS 101060]|uniref:BRCT domain-containing protein n=1 Tax=Patellaria atrata CBS 101060 TaxID=1346257 RepID=A0A9P4SEL1_9PEZI|nr:hypothetical protein M501DRAFT_551447 [Patellaria atrata CBS 101060]